MNVAYSQQPVRTGGTAPFAWAVTAGSLPAGLSINASTGSISGSPTAAGSFSVTITVTDSFNQVATTTATIVIAALPTLTFAAPASGQVGVAYSTSFTAAGGTAPLTWSVPAGALPAGLTLAAGTGVLSGTPTTVGNYSFTVAVTDANNKTASKAVTLVIAAGPLVIVKTANVNSAVVGSTVQYTVTVTNTGSTAFSGVALSDPLTGVLDDAVYNANATASTGTVSYASSTVSWTGNLAANGSVTINYSVTVNNPDVGNMVLANTVSSSTLGTNCAAGSVDARCTATVTVAGLTIVKSADVSSTTPGSTVHYSISVTNSGQTAYAPAALTDNLAGVLDDATYNSDATSTSGSIAISNGSLTWTGNLAVGASTTITYSVTVADPDTGNRSLTGTIISSTTGSTCPSSNPAASCSTTVTVLVPALVITNSSDVSTTTPGSTVPYTVTLSNTGQTAYTATAVNVALAAALDDATYSGNATASAGSVSYTAGTKTLTWTGDLAIGAVVTITASVTVNNPDAGDKTLTTVASSSAPGSTCPAGSSNSACTSTVQVLIPALTITKSTDVSSTTPGSIVHYTVSVTNSGQTNYTGAAFSDSLAGVLDDATYRNDAAATSGTVSFSASTVGWTGNLLTGATATITYSVLVNQPDTGNKSLTGTVTSTTPGNTCPSGGTDPRCTSSVTVLIPALTVTSAVDASTTTPGSVVNYTFSLSNTGQTAYSGATVVVDLTGVLDDATYNNDASATTGSLVINGNGTATWTISLAAGASASATLSATVNSPPAGNKTLSTTVTSDAPGSTCPTGSANTACKTTVTVLIPGLTFTKTANASAVTPGDTVAYTITVLNNGQSTYSTASFSDSLSMVLPDATYGGDATATSGTVSYSASTLSWTGALAPGASATITYSVTVRDPDPGNKRMVNTVVSSAAGNNCASGSTDARCTAAVNVLVPRLTITKTANVATTTPGAVIGYTITATNSGQTAYTGATFSDSLAGVLDDATYNSDVAAGTGTATYTNSTLGWTGDLAVGAAVTLTYSVTVHAADGGNNQLANTVISTTRGNNCPSAGSDARCTVTVPVARLVLSTSFQEATATPGSILHLSSTYTNTGQVAYPGISVTSPRSDVTDDAADNGDQTVSSGTLAFGSTTATWTGDIPVGAVVTITRTLTVQNPDTGNQRVTATLSSTAPGNNCLSGTTDARCTFLATVLTPALTISRTANTSATVPGGSVSYTTTIHNTGQTAYTAAVVTDHLAGALDDATYNANAVATSGALSFSSPSLTWTGDVAVGATVTITYSMTVKKPDPADKTMVSSVSSTNVGSTCPPASGDAACHNTVLVLTPALTIAKTANVASATLGSTVTYTVKVTNSGQTAYAAASFSDPLAGVLDDATYDQAATTATVGTVGYANGVLSWTGALNPGTAATITYTVTINNPSTGDRSMVNTVSSANDGNNCATGSTDNRCTATVAVTNAATLTFTKVADVPSTVAGGVVKYTVTAVNSSASTVASVDFTDSLGDILDDATYNADAAASSGTVTFTDPKLTWTGDIPAGATVTVTYSVTVHKPVTGNQILAGTVTSTSFPGSDNCLAGTTDPRCTSTVPVAGLVIEQHYTETSATPGQLLHLSATFTNTGAMPYTGIRISSPSADTVDDGIPSGDQTASSGDLVLSSTAITWTGSIPVGGVVTVVGTLTVKNPDPGNKIITGTLASTAPGNNCPAAGTDPQCTALINVLVPGLTISKSASTTTAVPGASVGYTVSIQNSGQTAYSAASVTDSLTGVLDDATYNTDAVTTSGTLSYNSPTLTWSGSLAVGTTVTITYSVTVKNPDPGDRTMASSISSADVGSTCPPGDGNGACSNTVTILNQALTLTSTTNSSTSVPGAVVTYTVTATNSGQTNYSAATFSAPLAGVLDDATYGSSSADTGSVTLAGQTLSWTGALAVGATATITYTVTVNNPDSGNHRLVQTLTSTTEGSSCPVGGTDARCTTSVLIADLHLINTADVSTAKPTSVVHYSATFTNTGQVPYVNIEVIDSFAAALDDATYNGDATATAGSVIIVVGSGRVVWNGDLAVGASVVVTGSVTVNNPDLGNKNLRTLLSTNAAGSNCPTGGSDPVCATSVTVLTPALSITQAVSTTITTPGSSVGYTITIANTGQTPYTAAVVSDSLQNLSTDATYENDATATSGTVNFADPTLTWTGDLNVGQSVVVTFSVRVNNPDQGGKSLTNRVVSDELGSTCATGSTNAACSTTVTVLIPALDIVTTTNTNTTTPGSAVAYTLTVRNTGQTEYNGASVTASLAGVIDDATYAGDGTSTTGAVTFTSPNLTWTGNLAVGAAVTITYSVTVNSPDTGNKMLATSVSSPAPGSTCTQSSPCVNTVTVLIPGLSITNTADVATATPGDPVRYSITLRNTGQTDYVGNVLTTSLSGVVDDATFDGTINSSAGTSTYSNSTLSWTGNLSVGAVVTIAYTVTVKNPDPGDKVLATTVQDSAAGSTCQSGGTDPSCTASVSVLVPALTISTSTGAPTTTPGSVVGFTVLISNTGQAAYTGAVVADSLQGLFPDSVYNGDAAVTGGGTLNYVDPTLRWTGDLPVGASVTVTFSVTVHDPDIGDKRMINTVSSTVAGSSCPPGGSAVACSAAVQVLVPALSITKVANVSTVTAGGDVTYTISLVNTGQTAYAPATFTDSLAAVLDDAVYNGGAVASTGSVQYSNSTLAWTGALAIGATATITYSVTTIFPATGDHSMTNAVVSTSPGSTCVTGAPAECRTAVTVLVPALTVSKTADSSEVVAGGRVQYTISATNTGEANYSAASVTDSLAGVLDDAVYNNDASASTGALSYSGGTLGWTGALPTGASVLISFTVTVNVSGSGSGSGDSVLTNRAVSTSAGSTCPSAGGGSGCATSTIVDTRTLSLSGLAPSFTLTGLPNSTVSQNGAVTMTVTTNSTTGYFVTVQAHADSLIGATPGNNAVVPLGSLRVRESGSSLFRALSATSPLVVHQQSGPSGPGGDGVSNDFQVQIPDVPSDTYSGTLDYIVAAQ